MYGLASAAALAALVYLAAYYRSPNYVVFAAKMAASLLFLLTGLLAPSVWNFRQTVVVAALTSGFLGDFALGIRRLFPKARRKVLVVGLVFFSVGHICYFATAAAIFVRHYAIILLITFALSTALTLLFAFTKVKFGRLQPAVAIYLLISSLMVTAIVMKYVLYPNYQQSLMALAAVAFVLSDVCLGYLYFRKLPRHAEKALRTANIITYFGAQILFALTLSV